MTDLTSSRRDFLKLAATTFGGSWLITHWPTVLAAGKAAGEARDAGFAFHVLDEQDARDLEAIAAQIIPSGDTPGAHEAGVVYFIDQALSTFASGGYAALQAGLKDLNSRVSRISADAMYFSDLGGEQQVSVLRQIEDDSFFQTVRQFTLWGMFALPAYGGNLNHSGWEMIGFDHRHAWQPPFGYYDAEYGKTGGDDDK